VANNDDDGRMEEDLAKKKEIPVVVRSAPLWSPVSLRQLALFSMFACWFQSAQTSQPTVGFIQPVRLFGRSVDVCVYIYIHT